MNMAVAELLHAALREDNINKYSDFNLVDIKTRMKGGIYIMDILEMVLELILLLVWLKRSTQIFI